MNRKLLNGTDVPALDVAVTLSVYTKCPWKYKLVDLETGQEYMGQLPQDNNSDWEKI